MIRGIFARSARPPGEPSAPPYTKKKKNGKADSIPHSGAIGIAFSETINRYPIVTSTRCLPGV